MDDLTDLDLSDEKVSKDMVDVDENSFDTDIKINPDFYIHMAILRAQNALLSPNLRDGFVRYRIFIEHIETLCRAADMLITDYDKELKDFQEKDDYKNTKDEFNKDVKLANHKLLLMMKAVFKKKPLTDPMRT